jgi:AraC family transcriptional regulator of adaptative response / DNA-3-methyladenine glycosylase II
MRVILPYKPPYDWASMSRFLAARATPGVERVDLDAYARTISVNGFTGSIAVARMAVADALTVDVSIPDRALIPPIVERVAAMFDVDHDPAAVLRAFGTQRLLKRACAAHAGIRLAGAWDPFELAVRAILGQQVSVKAATTMAGRVAAKWGEEVTTEHGLNRLFPWPATLTDAKLEKVGIIAKRAETIRRLAADVCSSKLAFTSPTVLDELRSIPGIGDWTAQYIAMRALKNVDAFPAGDLVLRRRAGNCTARMLERRSQKWRPWRAYAVMLLWTATED